MVSVPDPAAEPTAGEPATVNNVELVLEATERVRARMSDALGAHADPLYMLLGMVPNATRRVITEIGQAQTPQDECTLFLASRLFNNILAAFLLMERGMLTEANILARSAVEATAQAVLLLRDEQAATGWLAGKRFSPS